MAAAGADAEKLRQLGNTAFKSDKMHEAVELYSQALDALPEGHENRALVLSNRSVTNLRLKNYEAALADADAALVIRPGWGKAISRRAKALEYLGRDIEGFRMLVDVLEAQESMTPDIDADQRKSLGELRASFQKRLLQQLQPSRFGKSGDGTADKWLAAVEAQESWRMRLATLAHCWNASDVAGRMEVLRAAQADLAAAPAPGSVPIEQFAMQAAQGAGGAAEAAPSPEELEARVRVMLGGASETPPEPEAAGVKPEDLKPFPLHNYADITPHAALIAFFAALPTAEKGALWRHTWQRLRFFEKVLAANDFAMFFGPLVRLCPVLERAVTRLREAAEAAAPAAAEGEGAAAAAASGAGEDA